MCDADQEDQEDQEAWAVALEFALGVEPGAPDCYCLIFWLWVARHVASVDVPRVRHALDIMR